MSVLVLIIFIIELSLGQDVYTKSKHEAPQWSLQTIRGQAQAFMLTQ